MTEAVIVDVDDTLCLTEAASFDLENDVLAALGRPPMPRSVHLATWGEALLDAIPRRSPGVDIDRFAALFPVVHQRYLADGRLDVIPPENLRTLDELVADGRTIMLLTSRAEAEVRHLLEPGHVLAPRVTAAYHQGNTRFRKPDPRVFDPRYVTAAVDTFPQILPAIRALPPRGGGPGAGRASSNGADGRPR